MLESVCTRRDALLASSRSPRALAILRQFRSFNGEKQKKETENKKIRPREKKYHLKYHRPTEEGNGL